MMRYNITRIEEYDCKMLNVTVREDSSKTEVEDVHAGLTYPGITKTVLMSVV